MQTIIKDNWNEKWKQIPNENSNSKVDTFISTSGKVASRDKKTKKERLLNLGPAPNGFIYVDYWRAPDQRRKKLLHRFIMDLFEVPNPENHPNVSHRDNNKVNNHINNLYWCSDKEVYRKSYETQSKSRKARNTKLTESQVKHLKLQLKRGKIRRIQLSRMYKISTTQIKRIERGENWGHIKI